MDASLSSSSSILLSSYYLASVILKLSRSLRMMKIVCSRFLLFSQQLQVCNKFNDCGSLSHKNMGLLNNLDEIDTYMGSCFTIQFIISVGFSSSEGTQIDSKSQLTTFLNIVCYLVYSILNSSSFPTNVSRRV